MQTQYNVQYGRSLEGMAEGYRRSRRGLLPKLVQVTTITSANGAGSTDWVWTIVDDLTGVSYTLTVPGSATEATLATNALAAFAAHDQLPMLFSLGVTSVSDVVATLTAKHSNRSYTISATGGTGANTVADTQEAGGSGLNFGRFVARGTNDREIVAVGETTTLADLYGVLFRTDANNTRLVEVDTVAAEDLAERGKDWAILTEGHVLFKVEEAVAPGDPVFMRREGTGRIGGLRASAVGGAELVTVTPTAAEQQFSILITDLATGETLPLTSGEPDGSTTATEICNNWRTGAAAAQADGALPGYTFGGTATLTITGPAGVEFTVVDTGVGVSAVVYTTAADVDAIDISEIASFETSAAADELALVKIHMGAR